MRDTKGILHAKMGTIKDSDGMDLTEAEDIKTWQEYTEELYKKDLHGRNLTDLTEAEDIRRGGKNSQKNNTKKISMTQITTMV